MVKVRGGTVRILVTGGAGFIGSHLVERLLAAGHRVRVLDNLSTGKQANLPSHGDLEFVAGDVRDSAQIDPAVAGTEAIFHLAAVASVQASVDDPISTHGANFIGTLNLLEAARRHGVARFLYASSAAVYGDTAQLPVAESSVLRPLSPYAADKLAGEHYLFFYARKHGLAATAFRFFNVYGPRQDPSSPYSGVISIFVESAKMGRPVTIFGDGEQSRDFVYVSDLVEVLYRSLENSATHGEVLNVGRGVECTLRQVLQELEQLYGRPVERRHESPRVGDIRRSCANVERLMRTLTYKPETPIGVGLKRLLEYMAA
jgi:UDP-glucose 4-epimerase